jgi:succinoglycan biosynthesis transport protein ExoP
MKTLNDQYYSLRLTLEASFPAPSVFAVGAATEKDESANVACNLARAFAAAGYKTVIVDPNGGKIFQSEYGMRVPLAPDLSLMSRCATNGTIQNLSALALTGSLMRVSTSAKKMRESIAELRTRFDVVIVNAGVMPAAPEALQFASAADGVILTFRFGRKSQREDRELTTTLERIGAQLIGIIGIAAADDRRPEPAYRAPVEEVAEQSAPPRVIAGQLSPLTRVHTTKEAV